MSDKITINVEAITMPAPTKRVPATAGGCWYCETVDDKLDFSTEFDTYVHRECVVRALKDGASYPSEATIMAEEFGIIVHIDTSDANVTVLEGAAYIGPEYTVEIGNKPIDDFVVHGENYRVIIQRITKEGDK